MCPASVVTAMKLPQLDEAIALTAWPSCRRNGPLSKRTIAGPMTISISSPFWPPTAIAYRRPALALCWRTTMASGLCTRRRRSSLRGGSELSVPRDSTSSESMQATATIRPANTISVGMCTGDCARRVTALHQHRSTVLRPTCTARRRIWKPHRRFPIICTRLECTPGTTRAGGLLLAGTGGRLAQPDQKNGRIV